LPVPWDGQSAACLSLIMRGAGCEETLGELRAGAFAHPTSRELVDSTRGADREGLGWSGGTGVDVGRAGLV
jgi:hypothetical protein